MILEFMHVLTPEEVKESEKRLDRFWRFLKTCGDTEASNIRHKVFDLMLPQYQRLCKHSWRKTEWGYEGCRWCAKNKNSPTA